MTDYTKTAAGIVYHAPYPPTTPNPAGDALKAHDPTFCSHPGSCEDNLRDHDGVFCANLPARTPPPVSLDEVIEKLEAACARAEDEYLKLAAPDGTVTVNFRVTDLRALLNRIKERQ